MQRIPLDQAAPGMVLAKTLENEQGHVLMAEGTELTDALIERMDGLGVQLITVKGRPLDHLPPLEAPSLDRIRLETKRSFARVRDVPEMAKLEEMVLRHRLAHAEHVAEMLRREEADVRSEAEEPGADGD